MAIKFLGKYEKQPSETHDYPIDLSTWFSNRTDDILSYEVASTEGVTVTHIRLGQVIWLFVAGGVSGVRYKITLLVTTTSSPTPVVKEIEFLVTVMEL